MTVGDQTTAVVMGVIVLVCVVIGLAAPAADSFDRPCCPAANQVGE